MWWPFRAQAPDPDACRSYACAIQACLKKEDFDVTRCTAAVSALRRCCAALGAAGAQASVHCAPLPADGVGARGSQRQGGE